MELTESSDKFEDKRDVLIEGHSRKSEQECLKFKLIRKKRH